MKKIFIYLLISITVFTVGCKKESKQQYGDVVANITDNVIVETYDDMEDGADDLLEAVEELQEDQTSTSKLEKARTAWIETRAAWEASEGFLFGPVSDLDIDPNIDTWPLDSIGINAILAGTDVINKAYIDQLTGDAGTGLKGFHAIEYILWGSNGNRTAGSFSARELEYLVACAESLKGQALTLLNAWTIGGYANELKSQNGVYSSENAVLIELAEGIRGIAGEVWNTKIQNTLDGYQANGVEGGIREEESRFSNNTKLDFTNNIISIKNVYSGMYGTKGNGNGLNKVVKQLDQDLANKINTQINEAIAAIQNIGGNTSTTYSQALASDMASIETAQEKVEALETTIQNELLPLINKL